MFKPISIIKFIIFKICHLPSYLFFCKFNDKLDDNKILYCIQNILASIGNFFESIIDKSSDIIYKVFSFIVNIPSKIYNAICGS